MSQTGYCLKRCADCNILFITAKCNKNMEIRCPFGCRQQQKRDKSAARSRKYYNTSDGREIKRELNHNRYKKQGKPASCKIEGQIDTETKRHCILLIRLFYKKDISLKKAEVIFSYIFSKWRTRSLYYMPLRV